MARDNIRAYATDRGSAFAVGVGEYVIGVGESTAQG